MMVWLFMSVIPERERAHVKEILDKGMMGDVTLVNFTQEFECDYCRETRQLLQELSQISGNRIRVEVYDFVRDADAATKFGVDKIPATVITGGVVGHYGIRYFGVPAGYEFGSLLEDIIDVSRGSTRLSELTKQGLRQVSKPVHIQVFVTPTCPYCPGAVRLAHQFAFENKLIRADMIESSEFPQLVGKYQVMAVPKVVINDAVSFGGALPEPHFLEQVLLALEDRSHS
jgi:glutaredoxin-like protein